MNKVSSKSCFIASVVCIIAMILFMVFELYLTSTLFLLAGFVTCLVGMWARTDENTIAAYNDFKDMSKFKLGMEMKEVMDLNKGYVVGRIYDEHTTEHNNLCPTCGAHTENGKCSYCGNTYSVMLNIETLSYECRFGSRIFNFNSEGKLTGMKNLSYPLERYLIL